MTQGLRFFAVVGAVVGIFTLGSGCDCGKAPPHAVLKQEGEKCASNEECQTGLCNDTPFSGGTICLRACSSGCNPQDICETVAIVDLNPIYACVPDKGGLCRACSASTDCPYAGDQCVLVNGAGSCGRDCSFDGTCPDGYACAQGVDALGHNTAKQCQPRSGTCECTTATKGQKRSCQVTNALGTCGGYETCDPIKGFIGCDARVPQNELCNGIDDNCNGLIDETSDQVPNPSAGIAPLSCGKGLCFVSIPGCMDGGVIPTCTPKPAQAELCDGLDNDCDGTVDNGFGDKGQACTMGTGVCEAAGTKVCRLDGLGTQCTALASNPRTEVCNGLDDDCNGQVDDMGNTTCGNGVCRVAVPTCADGGVNSCTPDLTKKTTESCNSLDDDCDGVVDNGFNLLTDVNNCASCGIVCSAANAVSMCDGGTCAIKSCQGSWVDCNHQYGDGCELDTSTINDVPDDTYADQNCDGIDGTEAKAVFVDTLSGSDFNSGTKSQPVMTISRGLSLSSASGRNQVLVSRGTYLDAIVLKDGVGVYGGYDATNAWARSASYKSIVVAPSPGTPAVLGNNIASPTTVGWLELRAQNAITAGQASIAMQLNASSGVSVVSCTLVAGNGANGTNGSTGVNGSDGTQGSPGATGGDGTSSGGSGGTGGASSCATGGTGGLGGYDQQNGGLGGLSGASCGNGGAWGLCSTGSSSCGSLYGRTGQPGCAGADGAAGANGSGGLGYGTVVGNVWVPPNGANGVAGTHGKGGGGGGGGGGGAAQVCADLYVCVCTDGCYSDRGGGGGGGGGAGCRGAGGGGGGGGGSSIGILLVDSSPTIKSCNIQTGNGGNGGIGAKGGAGGTGAGGGTFGAHQDDSGDGGSGGKGGNGGSGGIGGGGGGGSSVGLFRWGTSSPSVSGLQYLTGLPGTGGPSQPGGSAGLDGVSTNVH